MEEYYYSNADVQPISGFGIDHCRAVVCRPHFDGYSTYGSSVSRDQQTPPFESVNLVHDKKLQRYTENNRTKLNSTHW